MRVLYQVQEMVRVESIREAAKVAREVEVYNELIAGVGELRATFFVEITDRSRMGVAAAFVVDHPSYRARATLPEATLVEDLSEATRSRP